MLDKKLKIPEYWQKSFWTLLIVLLLSSLFYYDTWQTMVSTWARTKTYNHGFVVAPISFWLMWLKREHFLSTRPSLCWPVLSIVIGSGLLWLIADLSHVLVVKQFAVVGMLISGIWSVIGTQVVATIFFPLFFLFFMVPVGDQLVAPLMEYTASFTVAMLRLTGLSVYREGTFFTLTSGNWSVVEACSGINYLIASLTLGFVYAYLNYNSYLKRTVFMVLSGIVPVIANGFRAYMIVMIGHLSGMRMAVGVDHIIYGGLFFGLVMLLLFYLGSFWRDLEAQPQRIPDINSESDADIGKQTWAILLCLGLTFLIIPLIASWLAKQQSGGELPKYLVNSNIQGWQAATAPQWGWKPYYSGAIEQKTDYFSDGQRVIGLYFGSFGKESQGTELVNSLNVLIKPDELNKWRIIGRATLPLAKVVADEAILNREGLDLLVLEWYQIGNKLTANTFEAKWYQLIKRLTGDGAAEMKIVLWTPTQHDHHDEARAALQTFMDAWFSRQSDMPL